MRICTKCGQNKKAVAYYRTSAANGGQRARICKECTKARQKPYVSAKTQALKDMAHNFDLL